MSLISHNETTRHPQSVIPDKQRGIMAILVHGLDGKVAAKHGFAAGKPLGVNETADFLHVRRRYVRALLQDPLFKAEMLQMLAAKRLGYMPDALERIAELMHSEQDGVSLKAAQSMLGETEKGAIAVNVAVNNAIGIRPGYVIKLDDTPIPADPA
jgi:hypothetical protein